MDNKNLFKEAIADAKAVREAALANAKAALEEALTPKLQSMLAAKLQEMDLNEEEELDEAKEELDEMELGQDTVATDDFQRVNARQRHASLEESEELEEEFDLSEILAELEEETLNEAEEKEEEEEEESEEKEEGEEEEEEMDVADMSVEDLKDLIKDIVSQEMGAEAPAEEEPAMNMGADAGEEAAAGDEDEIDLEELLAELDSLDEYAEEQPSRDMDGDGDVDADDVKMMKEALATIQTLRNELNEVNLLNAKLLYVNKIFKAKNLSESQKLQVIASFDKATNVKEAKVVFESLNATLTTAPAKKAIKESLGFASKAAGVAPNKTIVESNDVIARMQKLANIIK